MSAITPQIYNCYDGFVLREVRTADKDLLFRWANDSLTRRNAFSTAPISYENHEKWFANTLNSASRIQLILEKEGVPVGQIRLDIEDGTAEVDYSIAPEYRGKGYGKIICDMMVRYAKSHLEIKRIVARVKTSNVASKKCFLKNGFEATFEQFELVL